MLNFIIRNYNTQMTLRFILQFFPSCDNEKCLFSYDRARLKINKFPNIMNFDYFKQDSTLTEFQIFFSLFSNEPQQFRRPESWPISPGSNLKTRNLPFKKPNDHLFHLPNCHFSSSIQKLKFEILTFYCVSLFMTFQS